MNDNIENRTARFKLLAVTKSVSTFLMVKKFCFINEEEKSEESHVTDIETKF